VRAPKCISHFHQLKLDIENYTIVDLYFRIVQTNRVLVETNAIAFGTWKICKFFDDVDQEIVYCL
jgi:hypothetical protein